MRVHCALVSGLDRTRTSSIVSRVVLPKASLPSSTRIFLPRCQRGLSSRANVDGQGANNAITRNALSRFWLPSILARRPQSVEQSGTADLLERLGFFAKAYNGIYHCLPLGLRVQAKVEGLLDHHMQQLGASKVSLSSLSEVELWKRSLRFSDVRSELFRLRDRKDVEFLLTPTHEEEITNLAKEHVESWRDLPLRLYQISRKYRDEKRPRDGLLRAREFLMKDLYTFDMSAETAKSTYDEVQKAYHNFFADLKLPFIRAAASSGNMGGNMSHEYHLASSRGEDEVIVCSSCGYGANAEIAERHVQTSHTTIEVPELPSGSIQDMIKRLKDLQRTIHHEIFLTKDKTTLVIVMAPQRQSGTSINTHKVKEVSPIDSSLESPMETFLKNISETDSKQRETYSVLCVFDHQLRPHSLLQDSTSVDLGSEDHSPMGTAILRMAYSTPGVDLTSIQSGDTCPKCRQPESLAVQRTLELGHTFHLGERYSKPLNATIASPDSLPTNESLSHLSANEPAQQMSRTLLQMGCHGIGVSRLIAAVAETQKDALGLNWPRLMAPFEVVILPATGFAEEAREVYDMLSYGVAAVDCVIDDRAMNYGSKIRDAELIGYPVILTVGRDWKKQPQSCQLQWRRPRQQKVNIEALEVRRRVKEILNSY